MSAIEINQGQVITSPLQDAAIVDRVQKVVPIEIPKYLSELL